MSINNILNEIQKVDPEVLEQTTERRSLLKNIGSKLALAALPVAAGAFINKVYGKATDAVSDSMELLLTWQYFTDAFYKKAIGTSGLIPDSAKAAFSKIAADEAAHLKFFSDVITGAGGSLPAKPTYDFTGGAGTPSGEFGAAFTDYKTFLELAQLIEDTTVRAYGGQMPYLIPDNDLITFVMRIHSVQARHAAHVRSERYNIITPYKPWVTQANSDIVGKPSADKSYANDNNVYQLGMKLANLNGYTISNDTVTEAFDEPLSSVDINAILNQFIQP